MKKLYFLIAVILPLCACAGISTFDGNSTKQWIEIESSKQDLEGKTMDVCYRLNVRFSPEEATQRFDTDKACITKCCWYSDTKSIILNLNNDFGSELTQKGKANKYSLDTIVFNIRYSNLLNTIHATLNPSSILRSDGLITLDYIEVKQDTNLLKLGLGDLKIKDYSQEDDGHKGSYLYEEQNAPTEEQKQTEQELKETMDLQRVDTGLTKSEPEPITTTEVIIEPEHVITTAPLIEETKSPEQEFIKEDQKTIIGTLQTQASKEASISQKQALKEAQSQAAKLDEEALKIKENLAKNQTQVKAKNTQVKEALPKAQTIIQSKSYDLNDPIQRQEFLNKQLAYERSQAVALLKRFYEQDIDEYIRHLDKQEAAKGKVLLANDRTWKTAKTGYPVYRVSCIVKGQLGKTKNTMKAHLIPCGVYEVNLDTNKVLPKDITAITIVNKDYKY